MGAPGGVLEMSGDEEVEKTKANNEQRQQQQKKQNNHQGLCNGVGFKTLQLSGSLVQV